MLIAFLFNETTKKSDLACLTGKILCASLRTPCTSFFVSTSLDRPGPILFFGFLHVSSLATILPTLPSLKQRRSTPTTRRNQCRIWREIQMLFRKQQSLVIIRIGQWWYFAPVQRLHIICRKYGLTSDAQRLKI